MPPISARFVVEYHRFLNEDVFEVGLIPHVEDLPQLEKTEFLGGQFASIVIPGAGPQGRDLRRAYSIASSPDLWSAQRKLELCVKVVPNGPGTTYLKNLKVGQEAKLYLPYGDFVYESSPEREVYFIATGTGIAPFRSMVLSNMFLKSRPKKAKVLFGVKTASELFYESELVKTWNNSTYQVDPVFCLSRETIEKPHYFSGRVTAALQSETLSVDWMNSDFYLCGGSAMIDEVKKIALGNGTPKEHIFQEIYYKENNGR